MEASMEVPAHRGVASHVLAPLGRSWRRLRRRPRAMQMRTALIIVAIVVGLVAWLVLAPSGTPGGSERRRRGRGGVEHQCHPAEPGQHQHARRDRHEHQRGLPRRGHQQPGRQGGLRRGQGVQRADPGDPPLREPDQQRGRHQRPQDQPDHRPVRPDQRRQHAVAVQAVDPGQPGRLRRRRRRRHLGGRQPALRGPAGPDPAAERVVDHDELDQPGLALPVVDRCRHVAGALGRGAVGRQLGPPRPRQEGRRRRVRPGGRPGRAERRHAARPQEGRHHPGGADGGRQPGPDGHHRLRRAAGRREVQGGRRAVGHPHAPGERVVPLHRGRELAAVLPAAAAERLPVVHRGGAGSHSGARTSRRSTGRRA